MSVRAFYGNRLPTSYQRLRRATAVGARTGRSTNYVEQLRVFQALERDAQPASPVEFRGGQPLKRFRFLEDNLRIALLSKHPEIKGFTETEGGGPDRVIMEFVRRQRDLMQGPEKLTQAAAFQAVAQSEPFAGLLHTKGLVMERVRALRTVDAEAYAGKLDDMRPRDRERLVKRLERFDEMWRRILEPGRSSDRSNLHRATPWKARPW